MKNKSVPYNKHLDEYIMNQRLVWNFEFSKRKSLSVVNQDEYEKSDIKWEARYFWPENKVIILSALDNSLLDIAQYEQKHKEDYYYLLDAEDYNIKRRRNDLLYKPIHLKTKHALGYEPKINLDDLQNLPNKEHSMEQLEKIACKAREAGRVIHVKKESFTYKFATKPSIKLELARLEVFNKVFFSACIEGHSLYLVETISEHLLPKQISCDYVSFLKNIVQ